MCARANIPSDFALKYVVKTVGIPDFWTVLSDENGNTFIAFSEGFFFEMKVSMNARTSGASRKTAPNSPAMSEPFTPGSMSGNANRSMSSPTTVPSGKKLTIR